LDFSNDNTVTGTLIGGFYGTFDGKGHVIKNLHINATGKTGVSLFGGLSYGEIKNLGREGGSITGSGAVSASGVIRSLSDRGKISNCYNSSDITVDAGASGVVYLLTRGAIMENCYNTGNITAAIGGEAGGLVMGNNVGGTGTIINSYNTGNIKGQVFAGTIISVLNPSNNIKQILNMNNCFNFGNATVTGTGNRVGSIIAEFVSSDINLYAVNATNVYSRPNVASNNNGTVPKPNQPIGWSSTATENVKNAILDANLTMGENEKYSLEYSQSPAFATELGGAFKYAPGRTPKLAWEK
jgi:hypothetical protein